LSLSTYRVFGGGGGGRSSRGGNRYGGGGGYTMSLSFPPFTGAVKWLIIVNVAVFFLLRIAALAMPQASFLAEELLALTPAQVAHGYLWQLITYSFVHGGLGHILINMLMLWMFGAQLETDWGWKHFLEFYTVCVLGAALLTISVSYAGILGARPDIPTVGASGGIYGLLLAFGILYADRELFMFPLPFMIKAKYMVAILVLIVVASTLQPGPSGVAYMAHLGGLLFAFLYLKLIPRGGVGTLLSERYFGTRNAYYRWKRRRAGKKFEVYMRKHDPEKFFDEYGNYRDPATWDKKKDRGSRPPWVN
jgi:membrane associated rhomboid family serine protease